MTSCLEYNIILWGMGKDSERLFPYLNRYNEVWGDLFGRPLLKICEVWDSSPSKKGLDFCGQIVRSPQLENIRKYNAICIIAIYNRESIVSQLLHDGYEEGRDFFFWRDFCHETARKLINSSNMIFTQLAKNYNISGLATANRNAAFHGDIEILAHLLETVQESSLSEMCKMFLADLIVGCAFKKWDSSGEKKAILGEIYKTFSKEELFSGMEFYFGSKCEEIADFVYKTQWHPLFPRKIKTIGIYDERYANGGGQRLLSLVIPRYVRMGYRVVLITDEWQEEGEYFLPDGVHRVVLKNHYGGSFKQRLDEFVKYIKQYDIDVICYHHHLDDEHLLYEMLFIKTLGIPIVAELHLMFTFLFDSVNYMNGKLVKIYRLLDKLIVLSRYNEIFWKNLGCNAVYIPNPVENAEEWGNPVCFEKRSGKTILFIGRVDDAGKGGIDLPDIMEYVHSAYPDAILKVIGYCKKYFLDKLNKIVQRKSLEGVIQFCGYYTDVRPFYEEADVMLMTSSREGFPLVLSESKCFGVPTVMYELPYLELVQDGQGFIAVRQGDKKAAAEALIKILKDENLRRQMSLDAKESLRKFVEYDTSGAWKRVFDYLEHPVEIIEDKTQKTVQEILMQEIWDRR